MGTLAGKSPANTYKSLLKVADETNGISTSVSQLEDGEGTGNQDIFLTSGANERVVGYGGYTLYCNGSNWFSLSHPTGAADAG